MSRQKPGAPRVGDRFPRVSGDEPTASCVWEMTGTFSPRERG